MSEPIRVITLWQPWASLVIAGAKPFEFRGYRPPRTIVGQRVVIHAAARKIDRMECRAMLRTLQERDAYPQEAAELCLLPYLAIPVLERALETSATTETGRIDLTAHGDLPWAAGLGTAVVGEGRDGFEIARQEFGAEIPNVGGLEANYGWPLTDIEAWDMPVPARGKQGIWFWPTPEEFAL